MRDYKVGDKVVYVKHSGDYGTSIYKNDFLTFNIGQIYTVIGATQYGLFLKETGIGVNFDQIKPAIYDCKLNRTLYPELKPDGKGNLI